MTTKPWWTRPSTWLAAAAVLLLVAGGWLLWQARAAQAGAQAEPTSSREQVVQDFIELALARSEQGDLQGALEALNVGIAASPDNAPMAYYYRALLYLELGKNDEALADLDKAIEQNPHFPEAFAARGNVYLSMNRPASAVEDFNKALQLGLTEEPSIFINRGLAYFQLDIYDLAEKDFQKALELDPHSAAAWFNLGTLYLYQGEEEKAISAFDKAAETSPDLAAIYFNRAIAYAQLGETEKAIADLERFLSMPVSHNAQLQAQAILERLRNGEPVDLRSLTAPAEATEGATATPERQEQK